MNDEILPPDEARIVMPPDTCSYLPEQTASLEYRVFGAITAGQYGHLLARGWRRFGHYFFRPACPACTRCRSLRVDVQAFRPTKSQRRAVRRNEHIHRVVQKPTVTDAHIRLFNRYHADMHERRGWPYRETDVFDYFTGFIGELSFAFEHLYFRDDELVGVGLVDAVPGATSSLYFYHEPDWRDASPGTFSLVCELNEAKQAGLQHHYLGYWISECQSMAYKNRFQPHQILAEYVADAADPYWETQGPTSAGG